MARINAVQLTFHSEGLLADRVRAKVDVELQFTPDEVANRSRFRLFVALRGSDRGEGDRPDLSSLIRPNLHVFTPSFLGPIAIFMGLDEYHHVRAQRENATISFEAELPLSRLNEDPDTDICEVPPSFMAPDGIIEIPHEDEVYAHAELFAEVEQVNSAVVAVPGTDGELQRRLCEFLRDRYSG